jgi:hypothetical protein
MIIAGTTLTLAALGLSLYEVVKHDALQHETIAEGILEAQRKTQAETRPVTAEETARGLLGALGSQDELTRRAAVSQLTETIVSHKALEEETREALSEALLLAHSSTEDEEFKEELGRLLIGKVGGSRVAAFAVEHLGSSTETVRSYIAQSLITGATRGAQVRDKALELARGGGLRPQDVPAVLRRYLGKKAEPELLSMLQLKLSPKALKAVIVEVQNLDKPELMGAVLARVEQEGWLSEEKRMPWLSGRLLSAHIMTANKEELVRAVAAVKRRPALAKATSKAVKRRMNDENAEIRDVVAQVKFEEDPVVPEAPSSAEAAIAQ